MPTDATCFHVAVIGPSDTSEEVSAVFAAIGRLNTKLSKSGITLAAHHWTELPPGIGDPQGYIDDGLAWADIDFVVGLMRRKFGTPVKEAKSGTEHEVRLILELHARLGSPDLLFYFHRDAAESSPQIQEFAAFIQAKVLTGTYSEVEYLGRDVADHLRDKITEKATKVSGIPAMLGQLPSNRRITVEWILGAQMKDKEEAIPSLISFKNGNGEEFIYDCRVPNFQEFANWIMRSMGLAPKEGDLLLRYLLETSIESSRTNSDMVVAQLWLGNVFLLTHKKLGKCEFKIALAVPATGREKADKLRAQIDQGVLPFPPKKVFLGIDGAKNYIV